MARLKHHIIRTGMNALYFSGAAALLRPFFAGRGAIFMLHHVRPASDDAFQPNRHLEVTPDYLRTALRFLQQEGIAIVSLDEMLHRLRAPGEQQRLACFTCDDGYRDNRDVALPVMREFGAPMTVFVTTEFADGFGKLWWVALERLIAANDTIHLRDQDQTRAFACASAEDKAATFQILHDELRAKPSDAELHTVMHRLCADHGLDYHGISRDLCMDWNELRAFAQDPLVTIGAHTLSHCHLAKASDAEALREMVESRVRIAEEIGKEVRHFAYPYGDRDAAGIRDFALAGQAGFDSAVTTRPGMIFDDNLAHPHALPRISLNGNYQNERMLTLLTSGAATAMWNGFRRVNAA